jgi:crotonobetainyl-CoA:carnitine CoA-transferase CaiB-like acyl-CoA transferase
VLVAGNGDSIFRRLMAAIGRPDLEQDPALAHNDGRAANTGKIDRALEEWTQLRTQDEILAILDKARVPAGRIYSVADIASDPHYLARDMIVSTTAADGEPLKVPGIVPKLSATPGALAHPAPRLGEHTSEVGKGRGWPNRGDST